MHLSVAEFLNLDARLLLDFMDRGIPEGTQLDYKRTIGPEPLNGDTKSEFMKDVTAFANSEGGIIIYGYDEPDEHTGEKGQFHGVLSGQAIASTMERIVQDTSDPRLPGFLIKSVSIEADKSAVICYIPNSELKPHMYKGRYFKRHSESSIQMSAIEVRQTVLSSYSRRSEIDQAFERKETEQLKYYLGAEPGFILQAIPLIELGKLWDVHSDSFIEALRGRDRYHLAGDYALTCFAVPYVGVQCLNGDENRELTSKWHLEVSTFGHISAILRNQNTNDDGVHYLTAETMYLFKAFGALVDQLLDAAEVAGTRMLIRASYHNAQGTLFYRINSHRAYGPVRFDRVEFPELLLDFDSSATEVSTRYVEMMYHAFGINPSANDLPANE